jgi:membrane protein implicated in regulation of membrane protease activity
MMNSAILWILAGTAMVALEVFILPGIGLFFAGLSALVVGILVSLDMIHAENLMAQLGAFFVITGIWAIMLWKPLQKFRHRVTDKRTINNVVGDIAVVTEEGLSRGKTGHVKWSGTLLSARLHSNAKVEAIEGGQNVKIVEMEGAIALVEPVSDRI